VVFDAFLSEESCPHGSGARMGRCRARRSDEFMRTTFQNGLL
jgi:hypothetical protein